MNATPFTPNFVGSLGRYPFFDYVDSKSNQNFQYSSNINFIYSNNSNSTSSNISNLYFNINQGNTSSNISNLYFNTGIIDSNLLWWRYELQGTQLELINQKANQAILSTQQSVLSTTVSAQGFTLAYHTGQINTLEPKVANLENNTFTKDQTSNIFVTSNVLSNTSNTLANYNNLYNRPDIYTKDQTSNIFVTSNVLSNTSNTLANYNNLYNKPNIITDYNNLNNKVWTSNFNASINKPVLYNLSSSYVGIGTNNPSHILQVGNAGRLQIANDDSEYSQIGTDDNDGINNTKIKLSGVTKSIGAGNIEYNASGYNGGHVFSTNNYEVLRILHSGNVGIGIQDTLFKLDVNGNINAIEYYKNNNNISNIFVTQTNLNNSITTQSLDATNISIRTSNIVDSLQIKKLGINRSITYPYDWFGYNDSLLVVGTYLNVYSDINNNKANDYINLSTGTYGDGKLRLQGDGNTYLVGNTQLNLSSSNQIILSVAQGNNIRLEGNVVFKNGVVVKKSPKYFTTSRTANFDGISCLAYDIDINTLTNFETIDSINFRFFRIKIFFASGVMSYQRTPRSFDISMSNYNTLSISCVENDGYFSELDRASNSSYFLYKQNFNMITVCFPVSLFGSTNIKIAYIIEDLLGK